MTKEKFEKYDKTKDIYCECCKQYKPTSSFSYRSIHSDEKIRTALSCKTCDWFKRNHQGNIPSIDGYTNDDIIKTVSYIIEKKDGCVNELAEILNKTVQEIIDLIYTLNLKNLHIPVKSNCECCGKEIMNTISAYLTTKTPYCSYKCYWKDKPNKIGHGKENQFYKRIQTNCTNCGKQINIIPSEYKEVNSFGDNHNFCSQQCYWNYRSKYYINEKASMYDHEFTEEQREKSRKNLLERLKCDDRLDTGIQKIINNILDEENILYERERIFKYYSVDNFLSNYNGIIEVMGDYWHGSPLKYNKDKYLLNDVQQRQLHRDKIKYSYIKNHYDIEILYLWETDINKNPELCRLLIQKYISNDKKLENYHSFNWEIIDGELSLKKDLIIPYQDISVNQYRHLIKKKVG